MQQIIRIAVSPSGEIVGVYQDLPEFVSLMEALGPTSIRRAGHVEPTEGNRWTADMSPMGGPVLGPWASRQVALAAERSWLRDHLKLSSRSATWPPETARPEAIAASASRWERFVRRYPPDQPRTKLLALWVVPLLCIALRLLVDFIAWLVRS